MAQYSVKTGPLDEAGEDISAFASELCGFRERIDSLLSRLPEDMPDMRRRLARTKESLYEISRQTRGVGVALSEISDYYMNAERVAFNGYNLGFNMNTTNTLNVKPPIIRRSSGSVLFDRNILPDWLKMAVLEYERSQD